MEKLKFETPMLVKVESKNGEWNIDAYEVIHTLDDMKFEIKTIDYLKSKIEDKDLKEKINSIELDVDEDGNLITIVELNTILNEDEKDLLKEFLEYQYLGDVGKYLENECYTTLEEDDDPDSEAYLIINDEDIFTLKEI